jgi:hypothetical protein
MNIVSALIVGIAGALLAAFMLCFFALFSGTLAYFLWNYLAPVYLTFLPPLYLHIPWWHCVCLLWLIAIINPFKSSVNVDKK